MSLAEAQVVNGLERRRSERVPLALPVTVRGVSLDAKPFQEEAYTLSVSAHGALIALATTVTLGQALFLKNPQTQEEVGAWVTRFGTPRAGLSQIGVELVEPNADFWAARPRIKTTQDSVERRPEAQIHVFPGPRENGGPAPIAAFEAIETPPALASETIAPAAPQDVLLRALEQTLQQAAERVVASAASARLTAAVNQAAEAIENFGHSRIRQFEEHLMQYQQELMTSAREEFMSQLTTDVAAAEERLKNRAAELLEEGTNKAHADFSERIRGIADQAAAQFGERTAGSSAQELAQLSERVQASAGDVRNQIDVATATLTEAHSKIRQAYEGCDARLQEFHNELTRSKEQELEQFRERLRTVLSNLLSSL